MAREIKPAKKAAELIDTPKREMIELKDGFTRNSVSVGNDFIEARYNLGATTLKVFFQCATLIDSRNDNWLKNYKMSVIDFCKALNISNTHRTYVIKTIKELVKTTIELDDVWGTGNFTAYPVFSIFHYNNKEQTVSFGFNEYMFASLIKLKNNFTEIRTIKYIKQFDSKYTIRFYLFLKQYHNTNRDYRNFDIESLVELLKLPPSYENWNNLYKKAIYPAITEINEKSDIEVSEPEIIAKKGKKVLKFRLYYRNKSKQQAHDVLDGLIKQYKKFRTFNVFLGLPYKFESGTFRLNKIKDNQGRFEAFCDFNGENALAFSSPNRDEFLQILCGGIYQAYFEYFENELKERLDIEIWQKEQDRKKEFKLYFQRYLEKFQANNTIKKLDISH